MNIELVVFDMAGTTIENNGEIAAAFQTALKHFGYDVPTDAINMVMGYKKTKAIKMMLNLYGPPNNISEELIEDIHKIFLNEMIEHYNNVNEIKALPYAEEIFLFLKSKGIKVALDTGFTKQIADVIIEKLGWVKNNVIDCMVCSDEVPKGRPYSFMIEKIMQQVGVTDSKKVIKVGDTEVDVNEGLNANCMYSIGITTGTFTREQLSLHRPSFIIDHLSELEKIICS